MDIYVDFDDCLCETGRAFAALARRLFGVRVPYEEMRYFNMQKSFGLTDEQYEILLLRGHEPEELLKYEETPGASEVINGWIEEGHRVSVITGRPFSSYGPSRAWLDGHGLKNVPVYCFDKYGRENGTKDSVFSLTMEDFLKMRFDIAVEDSPLAFKYFSHLPGLKALVFDRPWNRDAVFPGPGYFRCRDWDSVRETAARLFP